MALSAAFAALSLAGPVALDAQQAQVPAQFQIDNFGRVNAGYFRGAQPEGRDYADLAALGVKVVINLTSHDAQRNEKTMVERNKMRSVQIPMTTNEPPTIAEMEAFLGIVNDPDNQPVYVHCVGGKHRTGVMTAVYRMMNDGISGEEAFREMKQYNYGPDFLHPEFKKFVQRFDGKSLTAALSARTGRID